MATHILRKCLYRVKIAKFPHDTQGRSFPPHGWVVCLRVFGCLAIPCAMWAAAHFFLLITSTRAAWEKLLNQTNLMEDVANASKKCPYCGEEIMLSAVKCKHCDEWLYKRSKPFSFKGRIRRKEHNWSLLASFLASGAISLLLEDGTDEAAIGAVLLTVVTLWFYLAQTVKRMHDIEWSGWWVLLNILFFPIGWIVTELYLIFLKGKSEPNRFGPAPYLD